MQKGEFCSPPLKHHGKAFLGGDSKKVHCHNVKRCFAAQKNAAKNGTRKKT